MKLHRIRLLLFLLAAWLLVGCWQENEITLYKDEQWQFESSFTYNPDEIPEIGASVPLLEGVSLDASSSLMNSGLTDMVFNEAMSVYQQYGYDASWEKSEALQGDITYTVLVDGAGWNSLADFMGGVGPNAFDLPTASVNVVELGDGSLHFTANMPPDMLGGFGAMLIPTTMQVRGGRIISSNADETRGGTAIWHNPTGYVEATLTPASTINGVVIGAMALIAVIVIGGGGYLLLQMGGGGRRRPPSRRRRRPSPAPNQSRGHGRFFG